MEMKFADTEVFREFIDIDICLYMIGDIVHQVIGKSAVLQVCLFLVHPKV